MNISQAIDNITYISRTFPQAEFDFISENPDDALPMLREAIGKAVEDPRGIGKDYQLHFYAMFFLGQFQDKESFPKLIEMVSLPAEDLEYLIGDAITSGLSDILYNTYNGDIELLKRTASNTEVDEFARSGVLDVMGQLYLDGNLDEKEWKTFITGCIHSGEDYSYFYDALQSMICGCHFVELLPEVRFLQDNELIDPMTMGNYDSCVDAMFKYREYNDRFCKASIRADDLKNWAMYENDHSQEKKDIGGKLDSFLKKEILQQTKGHKIGRNDPCPCGSGKKYKFCCMNKPASPLDVIEPETERSKLLRSYPYIGDDRLEGRVYLQDYYDEDAIETDRLLYLGLMHRPGFIWNQKQGQQQNRCREYLKLAFSRFEKTVESDHIMSFAEYDKKHSIHYYCSDWIGRLLGLLNQDDEMYDRVRSCCERLKT